ncbi:hypothetical protein GS421_13220 [Rhodococcus hoagii]|nr:hypothetical protein [Prescottella equi]
MVLVRIVGGVHGSNPAAPVNIHRCIGSAAGDHLRNHRVIAVQIDIVGDKIAELRLEAAHELAHAVGGEQSDRLGRVVVGARFGGGGRALEPPADITWTRPTTINATTTTAARTTRRWRDRGEPGSDSVSDSPPVPSPTR